MQIEALKIFCDVVRHHSLSRAAQANDITQSAVSQIIAQIEKRMGVQLLNRTTRPVQVTDLGRKYYDGCKELLEKYAALEGEIRQTAGNIAATVEVAAIYSIGLGDMEHYVRQFEQSRPGVKVRVDYCHPNKVYGKVETREADFGLVSFPRKSRDLTVSAWRDEVIVVACPVDHEFARMKSIHPAGLEGQAFIAFDTGLPIRRELDRFLRDQNVVVEVTREFDNVENIKKAVEVGAGISLLPEPTLRREVKAGALAALKIAGCKLIRPLAMISRRKNNLSELAREFMEMLGQPLLESRV